MRIALSFLCLVLVFVTDSQATKSPDTHTCIDNLTQIDGAKQEWALEHNKNSDAKPTWDDIRPYLADSFKSGTNQIPVCPQGGKYMLGRVGDRPTCSIGGAAHSLPPY
jgi:hypothetical protein